MSLSKTKQRSQGDGYSDMPLNTRQQNAVNIIKQWCPFTQQHQDCVQTAIKIISNVLYKPNEKRYQKLRLNKPKVKKVIVDVIGGIKILKLAGFEQKTEDNGEKILCIESPTTIEEFEQLTDIWLVLLKTQYINGINPDQNAPKGSPLPNQFKIPNTLQHEMSKYFQSNETAKSNKFQQYVQKSNDLNQSPTAYERYNYFGKAIKLLLKSSNDFFNLDLKNGLNDIDVSDIAALIVSEILCGYYDHDESYTNLILAEDLRIMAEQNDSIQQQYPIPTKQRLSILNTTKYKKRDKVLLEMKEEELTGIIRWIGTCPKWEEGLWFGIELDSENLIYGHNGYYNKERFFGCADNHGIYIREEQILELLINDKDDDEKKQEEKGYTVIDIGCGWGMFGRLLMDKNVRPYLSEIEKESVLKKVDLYGFDISDEMIDIGKQMKFDEYYKDMIVLDCKKNELQQFEDGTVDVIVSCNCIMQDKSMGHPNETFLIESNRLLKVNGWFVVTRRFHGVHLGIQLYAYLMIAQQLGWRNVFASRIREVFFIGWQKMENPTNL